MRLTRLALLALALVGCSRFVWNEEPFTPDPAPVTELVVSGHDTMYVLRGPSYYLLASQRSMLWNRDILDDVAWRYRELFGEAPPRIAVRVDSTSGAAGGTWRGVPLAVVAVPRRSEIGSRHDDENEARAMRDSIAARLLAGPMLAATAATTWLAARATDRSADTDAEPESASRPAVTRGALPAWVEAGALRILASPGAALRAAVEVRTNSKGVMPLASLFGVRWPERPNVAQLMGIRPDVRRGREGVMLGTVEAPRPTRERAGVPGVAPVFIAQSVTVLAFMRERDPSIVARLTDELARGRTVGDVLATTTTLPRDLGALEAEWKTWVERAAKRR